MDPAIRAANGLRVRNTLPRMALDELRSAKRLTQMEMAEILDVPQSSSSRLDDGAMTEIGGKISQRVFSLPDLIAAGFEAAGE